jgi:hypothetical protein
MNIVLSILVTTLLVLILTHPDSLKQGVIDLGIEIKEIVVAIDEAH